MMNDHHIFRLQVAVVHVVKVDDHDALECVHGEGIKGQGVEVVVEIDVIAVDDAHVDSCHVVSLS